MISVVVPVYNHRPYLLDAFVSAAASRFVSEVLVVDDGSTDGSIELLPRLLALSPKIRLIEEPSRANLGAPARLNQLVASAKQPWIAVLNSDDAFVSGRFEAAERTLRSGAADLIFGDIQIVDAAGATVGRRNSILHNEIAWPRSYDLERHVARNEFLPLLAVQNIAATTTNMLFTKGLHARIGGFRHFRYTHDWDFFLRAAWAGRIAYLPHSLVKYRLHATNTIKDARALVAADVREMFRGFHASEPGVLAHAEYVRNLDDNPYFTDTNAPLLYVVGVASDAARLALADRVGEPEARGIAFVTVVPPEAPESAYAVSFDDADASLTRSALLNLRLAASKRSYDRFVISRGLEPFPAVAAIHDRALVLRKARPVRSHEAEVERHVRVYPPLPGTQVRQWPVEAAGHYAAAAIAENDPPNDVARARFVASSAPGDRDVPTVFILPAFLAVGGAERILIDTMKQLAPSYRFVIVNTEPLHAAQGSMHGEAAPFADIYDLAESLSPGDRLAALRTLREAYDPAVVWLCNGSPWQIEHAVQIRDIFHNVALVDNQVYDHEAGWVAHLGAAGVRDADRYVAINERIRTVMLERYGIDSAKIDLIYHGTDMTRGDTFSLVSEAKLQARRNLGLPESGLLFGMVGRLTAQKRPLAFVALAAHSRRLGLPHHFVWAGMGELEDEVRQMAEREKLDNFTLLADVRDGLPVHQALSGLIVTSQFEGLPIAVLEALSLGLPVLSTDVGAIREVLERYDAGIVADGDDAASFERAFARYLERLSDLASAANAARARVRYDFSSKRMAQEYDASWRRAIAGRAR